MNKLILPAIAFALALAGCQQKPAAAVSEADAAAVLDAAKAAWISMDVARIDAQYTDAITSIDVSAPGLNEGSASIHKINAGYVAMKFDGMEFTTKRIVPLGPDLFLATGIARVTSTAGQVKQADLRFSELFQKQADGGWKIVHEHISFPPTTPQAPAAN